MVFDSWPRFRYLENRGSAKRHTVTGAITGGANTETIEDLQDRFAKMPLKNRRGTYNLSILP